MDTNLILGLLTAGGTVLLLLLGWGMKVVAKYIPALRNEKIQRLIYDTVKAQVRTTMPAVVKGPGKKDGISKEVALRRVIQGALGALGPLANEFAKMPLTDKKAVVHAAVHSVKKEEVE